MKKGTVLLLCTGNACRSQMAEGIVRKRLGDDLAVYSAGTHPAGVHPYASRALEEQGVNTTDHYSKHVSELSNVTFDLVVTLCNFADKSCPVFHNAKDRVHMPFEDPIHAIGTEDEVLAVFRESRDEIEKRLIPFLSNYFKLDLPS